MPKIDIDVLRFEDPFKDSIEFAFGKHSCGVYPSTDRVIFLDMIQLTELRDRINKLIDSNSSNT